MRSNMTLSLISLLYKDIAELWLLLKKSTDEIMHQDSVPLYAADIQDQLKKQFAYLSGGRGGDGCPVITFPDYPAFSEIPEKEFQNVLTYLTSIPSLRDAGIGFILVIDRRQDKWTSVKASILRIAASFPGNLQLVLVLRPTGFFHRALSDIAFKFNKDEFKMKVPVIMLGSVSELQGYIDKTQLTEDLGGTLDYCHSRWLSRRTAIEGFAQKVKQTAQILQSFGTELAETELPNDVQSTSSLLATHKEKKDKMKEDIRLAVEQGDDILGSISKPVTENPEYKLNQDQLDNQTTVERLLAQLHETETAFDEFWIKHEQKLEQCLRLRNFEQNFREVKAALDIVSERLTAFTDVGNSCSHVEHILKDLANFEEKSCETIAKARMLASEGDAFIQSNHYAVDSIIPKCSELHHLCDAFITETERRRNLLNKSLELHGLLEKSMKWCDEGIYLLASQPVDKCQSQDGAESALQEIEKFLDTGADNKIKELNKIYREYAQLLTEDLKEHVQKVFQKQESMEEMFQKRQVSLKKLAAKQTRPVQPVAPRPEAFVKSPYTSPGLQREYISNSESSALQRVNYRRGKSEMTELHQSRGGSTMDDEENLAVLRQHVMNELIETERAYVEELLCVLEGYAAEMDNPLMAHLISPELQNKKDILFGNMEEIYHFHNRIFLRELENYVEYPELVGRCFLDQMEDFQIYEKYCQNKPRSESLWRQFSDSVFFQECQRKLDHKLSLDSYLLKPVQRITKYQLLLKEMLKYSKNCEGAEDLQEALTSILGILKAVNDSMHQIAITGYDGNLNELGKLLMQGSFNVWTDHKKGHSKVKDLARFKPMQRHLFLHEKAVLFCKKREENGEGYEKAPSYSYKHSLNMAAVGITENVKGDAKKFEIWYNAREEVYIIQAPTPEVKATWVNEIRKVLTSQLQACREASQHRTLEQTQSLPLPTSSCTSPSRNHIRNTKKMEERKADLASLEGYGTTVAPKYPEKGKDDTSSTSECSVLSKKRFTLHSFTNLKNQKETPSPSAKSQILPMILLTGPASPTSPDKKAKRHEVVSDPTPFGLRDGSSFLTLDRAKWVSTSNLVQVIQRRRGWAKTSHSLDASEENDGWSSAEDPLNSSDAEEEGGGRGGEMKLTPGKYTVVTDYEKGVSEEFTVKSGDLVQLIREGEDGLWYVKNLSTGREGWIPANNLLILIGNSKSAQSLSSSESGTASSTLSTSSSCSDSCNASSTSFSDIKG
ncbi:guanine nucleotide exchange factor DBS isoform X7 [Falco biarmicus]|uniref:guanine nucleotide exchange factor DBS isoform X7 n=1 Tax=Falco cherrug TaxID=345164 RepID=UPI000FFBDDAA|nr:guanine nucleotide exchange factor DBS isoform X7 [Falco cherrug]XP_055657136.1 guanine nucleotide exchange factor DBS isoform X10 [Falco peregrinus]XP_056183175.1 guanine nucleotide exchange factor DBS isoform X7 [Falco biarmicus]